MSVTQSAGFFIPELAIERAVEQLRAALARVPDAKQQETTWQAWESLLPAGVVLRVLGHPFHDRSTLSALGAFDYGRGTLLARIGSSLAQALGQTVYSFAAADFLPFPAITRITPAGEVEWTQEAYEGGDALAALLDEAEAALGSGDREALLSLEPRFASAYGESSFGRFLDALSVQDAAPLGGSSFAVARLGRGFHLRKGSSGAADWIPATDRVDGEMDRVPLAIPVDTALKLLALREFPGEPLEALPACHTFSVKPELARWRPSPLERFCCRSRFDFESFEKITAAAKSQDCAPGALAATALDAFIHRMSSV